MFAGTEHLKTHLNFKCSGCLPISQFAPHFWKSYNSNIGTIRPCSCTNPEPKYIQCERCDEKFNVYECLCKSQFDYKSKIMLIQIPI